MSIHDWEVDRQAACARIARSSGTLKILLKTKDEHVFVERWIEHHARIVGLENLAIFDNVSTDERVLSVYRKYAARIPIIRFGGRHNRVHDVDRYPELYQALGRSTEFFTFLDTDEYLTLIAGDRYVCDAEIVEYLQRRRDVSVFPGTWLENVPGSDRRLSMPRRVHQFALPLVWGKPIISTNAGVGGYLNHNIQLEKSLYDGRIFTDLFVVHLKHLSPQQRIDANIRKLIARGFATPTDSLDAILARDTDHLGGQTRANVQLWVREIGMLRDRATPSGPPAASPRAYVDLADGNLRFSDPAGRRALTTFLTNADDFVRAVLRSDENEIIESQKLIWQEWKAMAESMGLDEP